MIELTEEQRQAVLLKGEAVRVRTPEIGEDLVLLRAAQYDSFRELLEDESRFR